MGKAATVPTNGGVAPRPAVRPRTERDLGAAERAAADFLRALGLQLDSESLRQTPRRMAQAYAEFLTPREFDLTTFPNDEGYDELVLVRAIPVSASTTCCPSRRPWATCPVRASSASKIARGGCSLTDPRCRSSQADRRLAAGTAPAARGRRSSSRPSPA